MILSNNLSSDLKKRKGFLEKVEQALLKITENENLTCKEKLNLILSLIDGLIRGNCIKIIIFEDHIIRFLFRCNAVKNHTVDILRTLKNKDKECLSLDITNSEKIIITLLEIQQFFIKNPCFYLRLYVGELQIKKSEREKGNAVSVKIIPFSSDTKH